jgi:hypothetical protein
VRPHRRFELDISVEKISERKNEPNFQTPSRIFVLCFSLCSVALSVRYQLRSIRLPSIRCLGLSRRIPVSLGEQRTGVALAWEHVQNMQTKKRTQISPSNCTADSQSAARLVGNQPAIPKSRHRHFAECINQKRSTPSAFISFSSWK